VDASEDTPEQAENMKLRSALMRALKEHISRAGLSQSQAAKLFGVTQPRVPDLMRGKIRPLWLVRAGEHGGRDGLACRNPCGGCGCIGGADELSHDVGRVARL
jgi:hypothetical protein